MSKMERPKRRIPEKKTKRNTTGRTKAAEYTGYLLELHKLQGTLLRHLEKEVS